MDDPVRRRGWFPIPEGRETEMRRAAMTAAVGFGQWIMRRQPRDDLTKMFVQAGEEAGLADYEIAEMLGEQMMRWAVAAFDAFHDKQVASEGANDG